MEPTFPLLRLPENVIIKVLKNLCFKPLFHFSLISTKTKNLVTTLGLRADSVEIRICRVIRIFVYFGNARFQFMIYNFSNDLDGELPADITLPVAAAYFGLPGQIIQLTTPLFNFSKWLNHIRTVFCCTLPPNVHFARGSERFDIGSLKNTIGNVNWLYVFRGSTNIHNKNIFKYFNESKNLYLDGNPFEAACETQKLFIQNFKSIGFYDVYSLDDLLSVNSENADFGYPISQKQFNQFVKHWIRGSNPRLQHFSLTIDTNDFVNGEVYLNGISCMEMNEEAKREIRQKQWRLSNCDVVQISRKDGTTAAIATKNDGDRRLNIHIIVLH